MREAVWTRGSGAWTIPLPAMLRVLVVDDHPILRAGLQAVLRAEPGFHCVGAAADAEQMWRLLERAQVDVVVVDHLLGDDDGLELCRRLRALPNPPGTVLYTARPTADLRTQALAAGTADVVDKADDVGVLFDAIRVAARPSYSAASWRRT